LSGSDDLYRFLSAKADAWRWSYGSRAGSAAASADLKDYLPSTLDEYLAAGGERHEAAVVAQSINGAAKFHSGLGHGPFVRRCRNSLQPIVDFGRGCHPHGPRRPHLNRSMLQARRSEASAIVDTFEDKGRGDGGRPSSTQVIEAAAAKGVTLTRASVEWQYEYGQPRVAKSLATLSVTDRNLVGRLSTLPLGRLHVLDLDDVAGMLWPASPNRSTQASHRKRTADAFRRIGALRAGFNTAIVGNRVIVGRRRSIPADPVAFAKAAKVRKMGGGISTRTRVAADRDAAVTRQLIRFFRLWQKKACRWDMEDLARQLCAKGELHEGYDYEEGEEAAFRRFAKGYSFALDEWTRFGDNDLAEVLGVVARSVLAPMPGGSVKRRAAQVKENEAAQADYDAAYAALALEYGRGADFADLLRWVYRRGDVAMSAFGRRQVAALTGVMTVADAKAALIKPRAPGRSLRTYGSAVREPVRRIHVRLGAPRRDLRFIPFVEGPPPRPKPGEPWVVPSFEKPRPISNGVKKILTIAAEETKIDPEVFPLGMTREEWMKMTA